MSKFKIAILADVPLGNLAQLRGCGCITHGNATWLESLVPAFDGNSNLDIHWVTMTKDLRYPTCQRAYGQTFHLLPRKKKLFSMLTAYKFESARIQRVVNQIEPDLVHAWGVEDVYGITGARLKNEPKLFSLQGCMSACLAADKSLPWLFRLQASLEHKTVMSYKTATGESCIAMQHLEQLNPQLGVSKVDYGVSSDFHQATWCPDKLPSVIFAGSITSAKGIHDLIDVFSDDTTKEISLKIAGEGEMRDVLEKKSPSNVKWLGKLSRRALIAEMSKSWALVMPTYADTGPSIVKEARVLGMPVITTVSAGASTYIEQSKSGYVISPGDLRSLSDAIQAICSSRQTCIQMGQCNHAEIREELHSSTTAERFSQLYLKLIKSQD